jgi:hypothetical protein
VPNNSTSDDQVQAHCTVAARSQSSKTGSPWIPPGLLVRTLQPRTRRDVAKSSGSTLQRASNSPSDNHIGTELIKHHGDATNCLVCRAPHFEARSGPSRLSNTRLVYMRTLVSSLLPQRSAPLASRLYPFLVLSFLRD